MSMPISATGNNRLAADAGVSLIEALMALMIVSMMAGAVVLMAPERRQSARLEAERLAARMQAAGEESIIANRALALRVSDEGYGFERFEDGRWVEIAHGAPLAFRPWPPGVEASVEQEAAGRAAHFDVLGGASAAPIVLSKDGARWRVSMDQQGQVYVARAE